MSTKHDHRAAGALAVLAAASILCAPSGGFSAAKKSQAAKSEVKAATADKNDAAYEQWLRKYGAYDRIAAAAPDSGDDTGAVSLKRAEGMILQGTPREALQVIEGQPPYEDPAQEVRRLWLGGQAHRALGDAYKAVIWYSHAAQLMDAKQVKQQLGAEPGLQALWVDVWRRQFWAYVGNPAAPREGLESTLTTLLDQALAAWGPENFWVKAKESLAMAKGGEQAADSDTEQTAKPAPAKAAKAKDKDAPLAIGDEDRLHIAQAAAAASLEDYDHAKEMLGGVSDAALRDFWTAFLNFLSTGKTPNAKGIAAAGYAKAAGFWYANPLAPYAANREEWFLGSVKSAAWTKFRNNIAQLPREEARATVEKELQSLLLSDDMSNLLRSMKMVLLLEDGDKDAARTVWDGLDKRKLPLSLRLAGGLVFDADFKSLLPQDAVAAAKLSPALSSLLAAGGNVTPLAGEAPFWTRMDVGKGSNVNKSWPLDRVLVLADWQARWVAAPGSELARRSAFLFQNTSYGYDCLLYLARRAVENRSFQLADAYFARMENMPVDKTQQAARLSLKAKMERDSGRDDEALKTFHELEALGTDMPVRARLDMATFLQLKNDFEGGRKQLLMIWDERDKLTRSEQAEVLFWLGEGEHSLRNYDAALDYYLRLAYQYPQEAMWPTAAMYRSAMIYEIKGNYEAAKKLLTSVIASADTKEAKEAARNRLSALEAKAGKPSAKESGEPVYPF
jgi:hypothetical protein